MVMYNQESMQDVNQRLAGGAAIYPPAAGRFCRPGPGLGGSGIYGVISYAVTQSTHEIGLRMALGATRWTVLGMVLSSAMRLALIGIAVGAITGLAATRALKGLLFKVSTWDPFTFTAVALVLAMVTLIGSYIPAWRAARVDPMVALRYE